MMNEGRQDIPATDPKFYDSSYEAITSNNDAITSNNDAMVQTLMAVSESDMFT